MCDLTYVAVSICVMLLLVAMAEHARRDCADARLHVELDTVHSQNQILQAQV